MKVTVYSKPMCVQCTATKRALDARGLPYDTVDLAEDAEAMEFVMRLGHRSAPVVVVDTDGRLQDHWSGFLPERISAL